MSNSNGTRNSFLLDLLDLQQDGRHAISAPTNWIDYKPTLHIRTEVDEVVDDLAQSILSRESNENARWHFFIGSPGNGKSAAMGSLCRQLISDQSCRVEDENGIPLDELDSSSIPYLINVFEEDKQYVSAQIVQDASVVRNPFSKKVDPAIDLLETLEFAWGKGVSLVVCTNRGVLEKALSDAHTDNKINQLPWFKILKAVVGADTDTTTQPLQIHEFKAKNAVFKQVAINCSHLDNRSLLLDRDTFDQLTQLAISSDKWAVCKECSVKEFCPFRTNREWLRDNEARAKVVRLLTRAEVMSGQVVVFREALALLSLLFSGCPNDYQNEHPCDWVHACFTNHDFFSLASRRIYMSLFSSYSPHGLESLETLRMRQMQSLRDLVEAKDPSLGSNTGPLEHVIGGNHPSTDVGVPRLLGRSGILASLDPCGVALPTDFYEKWDADFDAIPRDESGFFTQLEEKCVLTWKACESFLENISDHPVPEIYWSIKRWSSNFLLHFGALLEGRSAWARELDSFTELLSLVNLPVNGRSTDERRKIRQLNEQVEKLLSSVAGSHEQETVQLTESVTLTGRWVRETLRPRTVASGESGSVSLAVEFEGGERAVFAASMYVWLSQLEAARLDPHCFPQALLQGAMDARIRAASKSKYAFENNDVELEIETDSNKVFKLTRFDGEVDISYE